MTHFELSVCTSFFSEGEIESVQKNRAKLNTVSP